MLDETDILIDSSSLDSTSILPADKDKFFIVLDENGARSNDNVDLPAEVTKFLSASDCGGASHHQWCTLYPIVKVSQDGIENILSSVDSIGRFIGKAGRNLAQLQAGAGLYIFPLENKLYLASATVDIMKSVYGSNDAIDLAVHRVLARLKRYLEMFTRTPTALSHTQRIFISKEEKSVEEERFRRWAQAIKSDIYYSYDVSYPPLH